MYTILESLGLKKAIVIFAVAFSGVFVSTTGVVFAQNTDELCGGANLTLSKADCSVKNCGGKVM